MAEAFDSYSKTSAQTSYCTFKYGIRVIGFSIVLTTSRSIHSNCSSARLSGQKPVLPLLTKMPSMYASSHIYLYSPIGLPTKTLTVFLGAVLNKRYTNPSSDIISVLAGLHDADAVISDFVAALDTIIRNGRNRMLRWSCCVQVTLTDNTQFRYDKRPLRLLWRCSLLWEFFSRLTLHF
jgi:hypothetical protein